MRVSIMTACLLLAGCSTDNLLELAYPDREEVALVSSDGVDLVTYLCAPGETPEQTLERAKDAHRFVETNLDAAATIATDQLIDDVEEERGRLSTSIRMASALNRAAEVIVEETENRFQCLMVEIEEI